MGSLRVGHDEWLHFHFSPSCIGGGNGSPLQCSYLENPMDRGAWWTAVYGVTQSPTQLKRLSSSSVQGYCYHLSKFHIYALVYCIGVFLFLHIFNYIVKHFVFCYAQLIYALCVLWLAGSWPPVTLSPGAVSMKMLLLLSGKVVSDSFVTSWNYIACQPPLSMEFSR